MKCARVARFATTPDAHSPAGLSRSAFSRPQRPPSGANRQPWHFVVVTHPEIKREIRESAEAEEHALYTRRASDEWLEALEPLGTGPEKPFLERAPYLIVIFAKSYDVDGSGKKTKNYYVTESVGIATGILITAVSPGRSRIAHPYTLADGVSRRDSRPARQRAPIPGPRRRLSRRRRDGTGYREEDTR